MAATGTLGSQRRLLTGTQKGMDAKRDAEVTGDAWQPKTAADGDTERADARGTRRTAIDGDGPRGHR